MPTENVLGDVGAVDLRRIRDGLATLLDIG
jgi:hypothetical protein